MSSASAAPVGRPHRAVISKLSLTDSDERELTAAALALRIQPGYTRAETKLMAVSVAT